MKNKQDFDAGSYYNANKNSSNSYDEVFKSYNSNDNRKKKGNNKRTFLMIILVLLIIGIIIASGIFIYKSVGKFKNIIDDITDKTDELALEVELNDTELSLMVGDVVKLNYRMINVYDINLLAFVSSNPSIAAVDQEGKVSALSLGEATIVLSYVGKDGAVSKTCAVIVKDYETEIVEIQEEIDDSEEKNQPLTDEDYMKQMQEANKEQAEIIKKNAIEGAKKKGEELAKKASEEARKRAEAANK